MPADSNQAHQFLQALFGSKENSDYILIWTRDPKLSAWFTDLGKAAAYVQEQRARDVYVGVALSPADHGPHQRLKLEDNERPPSGIVALWADIDIGDGVHKKLNLAPSIDEAKAVLFPEFPPSVLIHSGGGLQAWWLLREPWRFESEDEIRQAGALAARWIRAIRARAAARGWDVDSVGDLPRVLRVPGTFNCKIPGQPRPVRLLDINEQRYNPSDLTEFLDMIGAERISEARAQVVVGELEYRSDAEPPVQRFDVLCQVEPRFKATWDHKRRDFKDTSASSYDMALANYAVQACWTDQEVANLLIAHRRRYKEDLKLRDSYYAATIRRARSRFQQADALMEIENLVTPPAPPVPDEDGEKKPPKPSTNDPLQKKSAICDQLTNAFGIQILRVIKYTSEPPEYALDTAKGCIRLGEVQNLIEQRPLGLKLAAVAGKIIPQFGKVAWAKIAQALLDACVEVHVGDEGTDAGLARSWLDGYLKAKPVLDSIEEADETKSPFHREGRVHIYGADFRRWIHINHGDRVPPKQMGILLRRAGAEPAAVSIARSTRQVWCLGEAFTAPVRTVGAPEWVNDDAAVEERVN